MSEFKDLMYMTTPPYRHRPWLTAKEAADYLSLAVTTIYNWKSQGLITYQKVHGVLRFKREDLDQMLNETRTERKYTNQEGPEDQI